MDDTRSDVEKLIAEMERLIGPVNASPTSPITLMETAVIAVRIDALRFEIRDLTKAVDKVVNAIDAAAPPKIPSLQPR
jgi:hypothetical protein